jgi:thiopurine S-methyltransferase
MTSIPKPPWQNPSLPAFWDHRFKGRVTPWDAKRVPDQLREFAQLQERPLRTLVPGCGSGWEVRALAEAGWDVTGLDFSAEAIATARTIVGPHSDRLALGDFFSFDSGAPFEAIYERTFLCALPRRLWPDYAARVAALLMPGGLLAGYFFFSDEPKGPPFGTSPAALHALLDPCFVREEDREVGDSIPMFQGRERWQVWRRRQGALPPVPTH